LVRRLALARTTKIILTTVAVWLVCVVALAYWYIVLGFQGLPSLVVPAAASPSVRRALCRTLVDSQEDGLINLAYILRDDNPAERG